MKPQCCKIVDIKFVETNSIMERHAMRSVAREKLVMFLVPCLLNDTENNKSAEQSFANELSSFIGYFESDITDVYYTH